MRRASQLAVVLSLTACHPGPSLGGAAPLFAIGAAPLPPAKHSGPLTPFIAREGPMARTSEGAVAQHRTGAFLVLLAPGKVADDLQSSPLLAASTHTGSLRLGDRWLVRLTPPAAVALQAWRKALDDTGAVAGVFPEGRRYAATAGPDRQSEQWGHRAAFADSEGAWRVVADEAASKVVVAVLDTGLDAGHPEFAGRVSAGGVNTLVDPPSNAIDDDEGHGTHCAGIVAAANDASGVRGVAPGARLLPIKVLGPNGGSDLSVLTGMVAAIDWRPNPDDGSRVRVISMSLGAAYEDVDALYTQAVAIARRHGIVVAIASGNDAFDYVVNPGNTPGAVAVGSTGHYLGWERLSPFSNGGSRLGLVAPGEAILSTYPRSMGDFSGFEVASGTSMATPYVAGVAALLAARYDPGNHRLDAAWTDAARARLLAAVDDLGPPGRDDWYGTGRIDAQRAVAPATLEEPPAP